MLGVVAVPHVLVASRRDRPKSSKHLGWSEAAPNNDDPLKCCCRYLLDVEPSEDPDFQSSAGPGESCGSLSSLCQAGPVSPRKMSLKNWGSCTNLLASTM